MSQCSVRSMIFLLLFLIVFMYFLFFYLLFIHQTYEAERLAWYMLGGGYTLSYDLVQYLYSSLSSFILFCFLIIITYILN